jgi:hypothetical protein
MRGDLAHALPQERIYRPLQLSRQVSGKRGRLAWLDEGRAGYGTLDLSLTQKVTSFATLKYEIYNVLGAKPKWLIGERLQYATEVDNYGRSVFVHLIIR